MSCTIGVMAYNEERNIVQVLCALLNQRIETVEIAEIVVVASGCTDRTVELAQEIARSHPLVRVEVQAERAGKAAAINRLIGIARGDVVVLVGADTLPAPWSIEHLVAPFADETVGMTGARVVPLNEPCDFIGFTVQMLWEFHHRLALRTPKLGEMVAFRNVVEAIPVSSATDEVALEAAIKALGLRLVYAPDAVVYNRGPQTLEDFLHQRRRIYAGHLQIAASDGYVASSMPLGNVVPLLLDEIRQYPDRLAWVMGSVLVEGWGRVLGTLDYTRGKSHRIWRPIGTSKEVCRQYESLLLVMLQCCDGTLKPSALMRKARSMSPAQGTLLWWDHLRGQVLFMLPGEDARGALEERIAALAAEIGFRYPSATSPVLAYHVLDFGPRPVPAETRTDEDGLQALALGA
ncbi:MAG: hypothetical protein RLZZ387_884 [Chloroflexota bacterium]